MKIAVNALAAYPGAAGIGRYAANVAWSLIGHGNGAEVLLLSREGSDFEGARLPEHVTLLACSPTGMLWEQLQLPGILQEHGVDLYHSPLFMAPIVRAARQLITVHDIIPEKLAEHTPPDFLRLWRRFFYPCLRASDGVLTVSEYSKSDIERTVDLGDRPVYVAYQAISPQFSLDRARAGAETVRRKLNLPEKFILWVGSVEPRKRIYELIDAFDALTKERKDVQLVICGRRLFPDYDAEAYAAGKGLSDRVRYVGYVADEDLPGLYGVAELLAFPSAYEGLGLPVVEAMACGCPVVSADNTSLPEAGGKAAVYADPEDACAFAEAMLLLLEDEKEREGRIELGLEHAAKFTRARFAGQLLNIYAQVLDGGTGN